MGAERRLIDANALTKKVESYTQLIVDVKHNRDMFYHGSGWNGALVAATVEIKDAPTVDAVEVVRCKNCLNRTKSKWCNLLMMDVSDDHFCAYGKRRDTENEN